MKRVERLSFSIGIVLFSALLSFGCADSSDNSSETASETDVPIEGQTETTETGTITITANGESFSTDAFLSADGWLIDFDHVLVTIADVEAIQTDPPWIPENGPLDIMLCSLKLDGPFTLDLADGPMEFGTVSDAPAGAYNVLRWTMVPGSESPSAGYSLYLSGTAAKYDQQQDYEMIYQFRIGFQESIRYTGGEFVGEVRKGILQPGGRTELELTFHLDHLFGDGTLPSDNQLNRAAPGFDVFAAFMQEGVVDVDMAFLRDNLPEEDSIRLEEALATLGHVGEGHCLHERL